MALYVAICLLAAFAALPEAGAHTHVIAIIWGVTIGLAVAHWFAFRVSARMVGAGSVRPHDVESAGAQLAGAAGVALLASVPVLVFPESVELELVELVLAAFIALVGFMVARGGGASRARALVYGLLVLVVAVAIALVKNGLAGHLRRSLPTGGRRRGLRHCSGASAGAPSNPPMNRTPNTAATSCRSAHPRPQARWSTTAEWSGGPGRPAWRRAAR
jgi:hypothetical protein